jgi:hypothetical protein
MAMKKIYNKCRIGGMGIISEFLACAILDTHGILCKGRGDIINYKTGDITEVKSTIIKNDLTSFSPKNTAKNITFIEFDLKNHQYKLYGPFLYSILDDVYVNANETFKNQQLSGRRPRISMQKVLKELQLYKPSKSGSIKSVLEPNKVVRIYHSNKL